MNFYGDDFRWFVGKVIDTDDGGKGRAKVRIFGIHSEEIPDDDLPWAKCMLPTTEPGTSGLGKIPQLGNNAFVFGIFLDGKLSQMPLVLGSMTQIEVESSVQREQQNKSDRIGATETGYGGDGTRGTNRRVAASYDVKGIVLNPNLVSMYDTGKDDLETRTVIAMQYLLDNGIAHEEAAAGIVGNLIGESGIVPDGKPGGAGEEGIAQWNPKVGRLDELKAYAKKYFPSKSYKDFFVQLNFLVYDMKDKNVWDNLSSKSIKHTYKVDAAFEDQKESNATFFFLTKFEIPANQPSALIKRQDHAEFAYDAYQEAKRKTTLDPFGGA